MSFKARAPPQFNPFNQNYTNFTKWRREFQRYADASNFFNDETELKIQHSRLLNIAGPDFDEFASRIFQSLTRLPFRQY